MIVHTLANVHIQMIIKRGKRNQMKIRTGLEFKNGKCDAFKPIRIKRWDSGYSIKCMLGKGTIVVRPYNEDTLEYDLKSFCDNCKEAEE
jgi:hypothetical protein